MRSNVNVPLAKQTIGILGPGEVGRSINALYEQQDCKPTMKDKSDTFNFKKLDVLNVCIPHSGEFIDTIKQEILQARPSLTIVHSTVPIGTTKQLVVLLNEEYNIVHSPIRGNHPDLTKSIQTFVKFVGSDEPKSLALATTHLRQLGIPVHCCGSYEKTEAAKLLCTTYYGLCIAWHNEMKKVCDKHDIDFDIVKHWNETYNTGYEQMGLKKFSRPVLTPPLNNKIGGHCVIPNAELLAADLKSNILMEILKYK
jgi:hypothetical protein